MAFEQDGYRPNTSLMAFSWHRNWATRIAVNLKLGNVWFYFRWRSRNVGGKRIIFDVDRIHPLLSLGKVHIEFDTRSVQAYGNRWDFELFEDFEPSFIWQLIRENYQRSAKERELEGPHNAT